MSYKDLKSYKGATVVYDFTADFCDKYIDKRSRTHDQMVQAARSGKQNIVEGASERTSKKLELKLYGVARASLQELLEDFEDFLRQNNLKQWGKDDTKAKQVRALAYKIDGSDKSNKSYWSYMSNKEDAANAMVGLINQTNYLLDRQIRAVEEKFVKEGGWSEGMKRGRDHERARRAVERGFGSMPDQNLSPEEFAKKLEEDLRDYKLKSD